MNKVILAFEDAHFSDGAFQFVTSLNKKSRVMVTGIFLPEVILSSLWSYADTTAGSLFVPLMEDENAEVIRGNIKKFEDLCKHHGIECRVHKDYFDFAIPALKAETRYADLLILGSESFYKNIGTDQPNEYLKEALHSAECPVIVVPEKHEQPSSNILAYDGTDSSIYAIKQFAYILPELASNPTMLVTASDNDESAPRDKDNIYELASCHFPQLSITNLNIDGNKYFGTWVSERKSSIVVAGSFGRSSFSLMIHKSFSSDVISGYKVPIFIAHK